MRTIRHLGPMAAAILLSGVVAAQQGNSPRVKLNIEPQPILAALEKFADQTGLQVVLRDESVVTEGLRSPRIVGELTPTEALSQLLANSALKYEFINPRTVAIQSKNEERARIERSVFQLAQGEGRAEEASGTPPVQKSDGKPSSGEEQSREGVEIEEVLVTARRREENAQSVPIAVTTFAQDELERYGINSIQELVNVVPGFSFTSTGGGENSLYLSLRGQGVQARSGNPGVITYLNEVPVPVDNYGISLGGPAMYFDLDNLQVLKGPQGTLFGRNSVGGAILFQTKRPTNEYEGHLQLGYGNYNSQQLDGVLNVPVVTDKLLVRLAVNAEERDGYTRVLATPDHPNGLYADDRSFVAARATVTFRPNDRFQNDLTLNTYDYSGVGTPYMVCCAFDPTNPLMVAYPSFAQDFARQQELGIRTQVPLSMNPAARGELRAISNVTQVNLRDGLTLRNIFGYMSFDRFIAFDVDSTAVALSDLTSIPIHTEQYSEELQLQGTSFGDRLNWTTGLFYSDAPAYGPFDFIGLNGRVVGGARNASTSKAIYGQATYDLSRWLGGLKLTGGLRYTWDEKLAENRANPTAAITSLASESEALTWNASLDYEVSPRTLVYLATRRGYRPGGANALLLVGQSPLENPPYGPEYVTDQELGLKSDWELAGVPIRTNIAVYHQDYTDIQVTQVISVVDTSVDPPRTISNSVTSNAGEAEIWGAEAEVSLQLTENLRFGAMIGWVDFEYTSFAPGVNAAQLITTERANRPPLNYGVNARYELPIAENLGTVSLSSNWTWKDEYIDGSTLNGPGDVYPSYGLLSFSADWNEISGSAFDASFYMTNVLDDPYKITAAGRVNSLGFDLAAYSEPRMYGLRLRYSFGR